MLRSRFRITCTVLLGTWLALTLWSAYSVFVLHQTDIYAENSVLENIQAILMAVACVVFLAPVAFEKRSDKLILLSCSLLCYTFLLRELDVEDFAVHNALIFIGSGAGRNASIAAAFTSIGAYAVFHFSHYTNMAVGFLRSKSAVLLLTGGAFLLAGRFFETLDAVIHHGYFEELAELSGYSLIVLAAFAARSPKQKSKSVPPTTLKRIDRLSRSFFPANDRKIRVYSSQSSGTVNESGRDESL